MKRIIFFISLTIILLVIIFHQRVIILFAERQLKNTFKDSNVTIAGCSLRPLAGLKLSGINIQKANVYELRIREAAANYTPFAFIKNKVFQFHLKDTGIFVSVPQKITLKIKDFKTNVKLEGKTLSLDSLTADFLGGFLQGDLSFTMDKKKDFRANLIFIGLDLDTFVKDFNLEERVQIAGRLNGGLTLGSSGFNINNLNGDFSSLAPGGRFAIKDSKFLENMAKDSQESESVLAESFKDYHYDTGVMKLYKQGETIVLDITLDGEAGKRDLEINFHT